MADIIERLRSPEGVLDGELSHEAADEIERAAGYAQRLATSLWEQHWKLDAPDWKPLPDLLGVLTQIDNMTAGLERKALTGREADPS